MSKESNRDRRPFFLRFINLQGKHNADVAFRWLTAGCAVAVIVIIAFIGIQLLLGSQRALWHFGPGFFFSEAWDPVNEQFGGAGSIRGTILTTIIAMLIAAPLSIVIALFLVELAPPGISGMIGGAIELLAAIPSIIYGMWGLFVLVPIVKAQLIPFLESTLGFLPLFQSYPNMLATGTGILTAGIILAIMILPFISAVARDVLRMVPTVIKESAYGMGSTTWEVTWKVSLRYGFSGIVGAMFLGLGRAIGETMAVTYVVGNIYRTHDSLFYPGTTIPATLAVEFPEATSQPMFVSTLIYLAFILFAITMLFQGVAQIWLHRIGKTMEAKA